jgi:hypothetical protein
VRGSEIGVVRPSTRFFVYRVAEAPDKIGEMHERRFLPHAVLLCALLASQVLGLAVADAATLCRKRSGVLVQRETCKKSEGIVDVAALGLVGPPGAPGRDGQPGPSAVIRKNFAYFTLGSNEYVTIGSLDLPAGNFVLETASWVVNTAPTPDGCDCRFEGQSGLTGANSFVFDRFASGVYSMPVSASTTATGPATIAWKCRNGQGDSGAIAIRDLSLTAIQVGSITLQ